MATMKIKKGDMVKVIAGKDIRTKRVRSLLLTEKTDTVLVEGVNMVTKHTKPSAQNQNGGIVHKEGSYRYFQRNVSSQRQSRTRVGFEM